MNLGVGFSAVPWEGSAPGSCPPQPGAVVPAGSRTRPASGAFTVGPPACPHSVFLDDFLATGRGDPAPQLEFEQLPFSHPLFIMYSSGTTGAPKCMVHSAGVGLCPRAPARPCGALWVLTLHPRGSRGWPGRAHV